MVASGSDDRSVRIWDVARNKQIHQFNDHTGMVNKVQFHPDSTCLASCGTDKKIKIFDCRSHRLLQHYDAHDGAVNSIAFNQAGTLLISTGTDGVVKIWDLRRGCIMYTLFGHEGVTTAATFSPASDYFLSGGNDGVVLCWGSNLNPVRTEDLAEIQTRQETELFVTQKEKVEKLPSMRGTKMENGQKGKKKKRAGGARSPGASPERIEEDASDISGSGRKKRELSPARQVVNNVTYR